MGNIGDTLQAAASKLREKQKTLNRARNISTSYKGPTVLGQPVRLLNGLYYPVLPNGAINATEGGYTSHDLDRGIGQGNATQGRVFKGSDGTWRFADGTVVTKFKSPATTGTTTSTSQGTTTSTSQKTSTQPVTSRKSVGKNQRGTVNTSSTAREVPKPSTFNFNGKTYEGFSMIPVNPDTQPQKSVLKEQPQQSWDEYINQPIVENTPSSINYDTNYIRGFRGQEQQGYRDVNSYLTWLGNNKNSDDYKLFMQNGYFNDSGDLDYGQIGAMLASQGIRGNLGRRDSRRLGNVLTRLRNQSTAGTPENKQFLQGVVSSYNQNKNKWGLTSNAELGKDGKIRLLNNSSSPSSFTTSVTNFFNKYPNFESVKSQTFSNFLPVTSYDFWRNPGVLSTIYQNIPLWKKNNN